MSRRPLVLATAVLLLTACSHAPIPQLPAGEARVRVTPPPAALPAPEQEAVRERPLLHQSQPNGLQIFHLPQQRPGVARVQLALASGLVDAGDDRRRQLALLRETGTETSAAAWRQTLASHGFSANAWATRHSSVLELSGPAEQLAILQTLLLRWAATPGWSEDARRQTDLELALGARLEGFSGTDAQRLWNRLAYGEAHPYALQPRRSNTDLPSLHARWRAAVRADQAALLISADPASIERLPAPEWPLATSTPLASQTPSPLPAATDPLQIHILHAADARQVSVRVGDVWTPPTGTDALKEQIELEALADVLGRGVGGRLWADLREVQGLAYSLGAGVEKAPLAHGLTLNASGAPEKTVALLHGLLSHRRLLAESPADAVEMAVVQAQRASRNARLQDDDRQGLALQVERWRSRIRSADSDAANRHGDALQARDLQALARARLSKAPVIVIRGNAGQLRNGLQKAFPEAGIHVH